MGAYPPVSTIDRASVSLAREQARAVSREAGLSVEDAERMALAVSELAQNQLDHARDGRVTVRHIEREGVGGVEVEVRDRGVGVPDPAGALEGTASGRGLGVGLASVRRMVEELDLDVRYGEGTTVTVRRFARPLPRRPEVVALGRGVEAPSGDVAVVRRDADRVVVAVIDGAGHGAPAREAADRAAAEVAVGMPPADIVAAMDLALRGTRGAACTLVVVDADRRATFLGVGNVAAAIVSPAGLTRYVPQAGMVGRRHRTTSAERTYPLPPSALVVLCSDGISSGALGQDLVGRSPARVAQHLLTTYGKPHDDALVVVAR